MPIIVTGTVYAVWNKKIYPCLKNLNDPIYKISLNFCLQSSSVTGVEKHVCVFTLSLAIIHLPTASYQQVETLISFFYQVIFIIIWPSNTFLMLIRICCHSLSLSLSHDPLSKQPLTEMNGDCLVVKQKLFTLTTWPTLSIYSVSFS